MLWNKGVKGIKTGVTNTAGPCLSTCLSRGDWEFIIVVLSCKSMEARWVETNKLANWTHQRLLKISNYNEADTNARILNRIKHL
mmetsp:Transcript_21229/g.20380  ORF Transcript_21229/g.20380 Transcript_21229/m.20380 type:complete len:84 (+) Transcript_21229:1317-1568(+)